MKADRKRTRIEGRFFLLVTLGCFRNEVESDILRSALLGLGLIETQSIDDADVIIVNTCGFIQAACDEGIDTLLELEAHASAVTPSPKIIAVGCMGQRYGRDLLDAMPELGGVLGAGWHGDLVNALHTVLGGGKFSGGMAAPRASSRPDITRSVDSSDNATLFVRVADGCDRACAFCTIPQIRGRYLSRPPADIVAEIVRLSADRQREVVLVAQDLTSYGCDLGLEDGLLRLIKAITALDQVRWLRLLYLQPEGVTEELIEAVASNRKVCDYFDIPFQHASAKILKAMGRAGDSARYLAIVNKIRESSPRAAVRTTLMVGYPGETEDDFAHLLMFATEARFDWLGAFVYSPEEGTRAACMRATVSGDTALARYDRILALQDSVEASSLGRFAGSTLEVLVEDEAGVADFDYVGRSYREAPVVDGVIYLNRNDMRRGGRSVEAGDFVMATITGQEGLDLVGEIRGADKRGKGRP